MRRHLEGFDLLHDIWLAIAPYLLFILVCILLFIFVLDRVIPWEEPPPPPEFIFSNVGLCIGPYRMRVERFEVGDKQYICADMETDEPETNLYLYVFKSENRDQVYISRAASTSGPIAFYVKPLPPGKYLAAIYWARTSLVEFEFEVVER